LRIIVNSRALMRSLLVVFLGASNSELLFGNMRPINFILDSGVWLIYAPLLVFLDVLVRRQHFGYLRVWLSGILFGLLLECCMVGMVGEGFGIMVIVMLWHAFFTITLTMMIVDMLMPRDTSRSVASKTGRVAHWLLAAVGLLMGGGMFLAQGLPAIGSRPLDALLCLISALIVAAVLFALRKREDAPKPRVSIILILLIVGFSLGLKLIEIENADPAKQPIQEIDHLIRAALYAAMAAVVVVKARESWQAFSLATARE